MSETAPSSADGPRRVAIIGAGPSGLYAAQALTQQDEHAVEVDVFDVLPTPYGLLRYGVAPDHTSIKSVATTLARVFESPHIRFFGLVALGRDVTRAELLAGYDAVIYAAGASEDMRMGVPGEDLRGSGSAREFVAWYSGHPDATAQDLEAVSTAVTVGVGNVAVDVARMLLKSGPALAETDMPDAVLSVLAQAAVRDVWVVGRRGPQHASFTPQELRELVGLPGVAVSVSEGAFDAIAEPDLDRRTRTNIEVLRAAAERDDTDTSARLHFLFWHRPHAIEGDGAVRRLVVERTRLGADGRVEGTGDLTVLDTQLVLRAIGYRGKALADVPFDAERGVIPNEAGRVLDERGVPVPHEYVVGWIKRGPIGVIGTNKSDATETVRHLLSDLDALPRRDLTDVVAALATRGHAPSTFADWQRIDAAEIARGDVQGRARTKIEAWSELLDLARSGRPGGPPAPADGDRGGL